MVSFNMVVKLLAFEPLILLAFELDPSTGVHTGPSVTDAVHAIVRKRNNYSLQMLSALANWRSKHVCHNHTLRCGTNQAGRQTKFSLRPFCWLP